MESMPVSPVKNIIVIFCMAKDQTYITRSKPPPVRIVARDSRPTHPTGETVDTAGEQDLKKAAARAGPLTGEVRPEISTREEEDRRNMRRRHRNNYSSLQRVRNPQWCSSQWCSSQVASLGNSIIISSRVEHIRVEQDSMRGQPACPPTTILARETTHHCRSKEDTEGNDN